MNSEQQQKALKKALVGYGFDKKLIQSIKGDKSLRDTVYNRKKHNSSVDKSIHKIMSVCEYLLLETGVHRLSIGFNNGEIKTFSIFDPANMEVHLAADLLDQDYLASHFVVISLAEKSRFFKRLYTMLAKDKIFEYLSSDWQNTFKARNKAMQYAQLTNIEDLRYILSVLPCLRNLEGYFLRTASIGLFNSTINMTFNCDGTQIVAHQVFKDFVQNNII